MLLFCLLRYCSLQVRVILLYRLPAKEQIVHIVICRSQNRQNRLIHFFSFDSLHKKAGTSKNIFAVSAEYSQMIHLPKTFNSLLLFRMNVLLQGFVCLINRKRAYQMSSGFQNSVYLIQGSSVISDMLQDMIFFLLVTRWG